MTLQYFKIMAKYCTAVNENLDYTGFIFYFIFYSLCYLCLIKNYVFT